MVLEVCNTIIFSGCLHTEIGTLLYGLPLNAIWRFISAVSRYGASVDSIQGFRIVVEKVPIVLKALSFLCARGNYIYLHSLAQDLRVRPVKQSHTHHAYMWLHVMASCCW